MPLVLNGATSGSTTITPTDAVTVVLTAPATSGTLAVSGGSTSFTNLAYTGTLTGGTGVVNLGSGQFYKDASGNVGIGTSSPITPLDVKADTFAQGLNIKGRTSDNFGLITFSTTGGTVNSYIGSPDSIALTFYTNGFNERMRIDSSGNLLVGCTGTPSASVGGIQLQGGQSAQFIQTSALSTGGYDHWNLYNGNGLVGHVYTSSSSTTYATSSDYRLKENVIPMTGALDKIAQLKPVTYKWKVDGSDGQGFIAHELQAIVPDCVTGEKDAVDSEGNPKYQGIDTSFLVATLTAAIQELNAKVTALEAQLGAK
jgi:hypothetical protein